MSDSPFGFANASRSASNDGYAVPVTPASRFGAGAPVTVASVGAPPTPPAPSNESVPAVSDATSSAVTSSKPAHSGTTGTHARHGTPPVATSVMVMSASPPGAGASIS